MTWTAVVSNHVVRIAGWRRMFRAVMLSAVVLCAQSGDWAQVQALTPGAQVDVKRFSGGGRVKGVVESVSEDTLVLQQKGGSVTLDRTDVRRLRLYSDEKTKVGRITGVAILGGIAGISAPLIGAARGAALIGVYSGVGYLIGWAADGPKRITLYQVERP